MVLAVAVAQWRVTVPAKAAVVEEVVAAHPMRRDTAVVPTSTARPMHLMPLPLLPVLLQVHQQRHTVATLGTAESAPKGGRWSGHPHQQGTLAMHSAMVPVVSADPDRTRRQGHLGR